MKNLFQILIMTFLLSCKSDISKNKIETISEDIKELQQYMKFGLLIPEKVIFQKIIYNNSSNERLSVSGSSDYCITAVLYFRNESLQTLKGVYVGKKDKSNYELIDTKIKGFPEEINTEIITLKGKPNVYSDTIFNTPNGRFMLLKNKIVLHFFTT